MTLSESNGSSSPPVSKKAKKEENFDPCEFVHESLAEESVQEMSIGSADVEYEFATHVVKGGIYEPRGHNFLAIFPPNFD